MSSGLAGGTASGGGGAVGNSLRPAAAASSVVQPHSINIAQQQEDLLTQANPIGQAANGGAGSNRPTWAVTTSTSPIGILTPTPSGPMPNNSQNWINSRPNSSSIHTPSPTNLAPNMPSSAVAALPTQVRLPPPLAPLTTPQQPPSSMPPPAYTPPTHLSHHSSS